MAGASSGGSTVGSTHHAWIAVRVSGCGGQYAGAGVAGAQRVTNMEWRFCKYVYAALFLI